MDCVLMRRSAGITRLERSSNMSSARQSRPLPLHSVFRVRTENLSNSYVTPIPDSLESADAAVSLFPIFNPPRIQLTW